MAYGTLHQDLANNNIGCKEYIYDDNNKDDKEKDNGDNNHNNDDKYNNDEDNNDEDNDDNENHNDNLDTIVEDQFVSELNSYPPKKIIRVN